jgi:hypothetical protein
MISANKEPLKISLWVLVILKRIVIWLLVNGYPDLDSKGKINEIVISF